MSSISTSGFATRAEDYSANTINAPDLTAGLTVRRRAIKNAAQARSIISVLETASRERNSKNARIMAKYNSAKPYTQSQLDSEGLGWKSNFTTKPLPMLIDKVAPRFVRAVDGVKYLTNSALPETFPGAALKTEAFRREITSTIRTRIGWNDFVAELSMENALFGFTCVACLDEFGWFPKHFRQDEFDVPTGTKHLAQTAQVIVLRETFLIHELFSLIEDRESAEASGWSLKSTVAAINSAMPETRRNKDTNWERVYEDLYRESNVGLSLEAGALTVSVRHVLATEANGKVSHYILTDKATTSNVRDEDKFEGADVLFEREDRFDSMSECASFFSFQLGNGKLQSSKGIGREIYEMAGMLDRARNEVVDRLNLAGKLIVQGDEKTLRKFKMSVVGNVLLIGQNYQISERKIDSAVEPFLKLDEFMTRLLDQMAGATTPKAFEGERVTKAAVELFASREEESRDNIIGRFLGQFSRMMTMIQKRLCNKHTSEDDAKEMQKRLLKIMSREELDNLANQPIAESVKDFTSQERQQIVEIAVEARGNPLYNQREIERRKLTALIGEDFADGVLLPEEDSTVIAEQSRQQQLELLIIVGQAAAVQVSPRDNHLVHLKVMEPALEAAGTEAVKGAGGLDVLHALLNHAQAHHDSAKIAGVPPESLQATEQFLKKLTVAVEKLSALDKQQKAIANGGTPPPDVAAPVAPIQ